MKTKSEQIQEQMDADFHKRISKLSPHEQELAILEEERFADIFYIRRNNSCTGIA